MKITVLLTSIFFLSTQMAVSAAYAAAYITVDGKAYQTAEEASAAIKDFSQIVLSSGVHIGELKVKANDVFITGENGSIVEVTEASSRGFFLISGDRVSIDNISCQGSTKKNKGACIWHNGVDLTVYNSSFRYQGTAILDIAKKGTLYIDSCVFHTGGKSKNKTVAEISSPNLQMYNTQFKGAIKGAQLLKVKALDTQITSSLFIAGKQTGRLIDFPLGGKVFIENSLLVQSKVASSSQVVSFGSSLLGRKRQHVFKAQNNMMLLEREKGSVFFTWQFTKFLQDSQKISIDIKKNAFIGDFKDQDMFLNSNLVLLDREKAGLSREKLPDFKRVPEYLKLLSLMHGEQYD